jgi:hypothetical protein
METRSAPHIVEIDRMDDGALITFEDGKSAVYSAALLRTMFAEAHEMPEAENEE